MAPTLSFFSAANFLAFFSSAFFRCYSHVSHTFSAFSFFNFSFTSPNAFVLIVHNFSNYFFFFAEPFIVSFSYNFLFFFSPYKHFPFLFLARFYNFTIRSTCIFKYLPSPSIYSWFFYLALVHLLPHHHSYSCWEKKRKLKICDSVFILAQKHGGLCWIPSDPFDFSLVLCWLWIWFIRSGSSASISGSSYPAVWLVVLC